MSALLILAAALLALAAPAQAAPGDLDRSFSGDGRQVTDFGGQDVAADVAVQGDGKVVAVGYAGADFALARYNPDGSLDTSFSADGRQTTDFDGFADGAAGVALQSDGKIVAAGHAGEDFALGRYNPDGSLDPTFSGDGRLTTDFDGAIDEAGDVLLQPDGRIVVAGHTLAGAYDFALARYEPDGSLDPGFSDDGTLTIDFGPDDAASAIALQADGRIVAAGRTGSDFWGGYDFALARLTPDGSLNAGFSGDGLQVTELGGDDLAYDVALQYDGKVVAVGYGGSAGYDFALARYTNDGSLDLSFSDDGTQTTHFSAFDGASGVAIQADGRIVAAGHAGRGPGPADFALARYGPDGSLDTTFSDDGRQTTDFGYDDGAAAVALQSDGRIVAAGLTGPINGGRDFALARYDGGAETGTAPTNSRPPTISGAATEGHTLTVTAGTWAGSDPLTLTHRWLRCDAAGANCVDIAGGATYTLTAADVGRTIRVRETATNPFGTGAVDSAATAPVEARPGAITGVVRRYGSNAAIAGATVTCGSGLSATTGGSGVFTIPNVPPAAYSCTAAAKHYRPATATVTVASGQTATVNFFLHRR